MTTNDETQKKSLWLGIEENLLELNPGELSGQAKEAAIQKIIGDLDTAGFKVSTSGGRIMQLRWAMDDMLEVGRPLMKDFNDAIDQAKNQYRFSQPNASQSCPRCLSASCGCVIRFTRDPRPGVRY